jgi:hypothetical protein
MVLCAFVEFLDVSVLKSHLYEHCLKVRSVWMLEILLIVVIICLVLTFFYKQAVCEFRLNQIEWGQVGEKMGDLLTEKVPIVVRGRPPTAFWTQEDVHLREVYATVPIFDNQSLPDWIMSATPESRCPWSTAHARILGLRSVSGLEHWVDRALNPVLYGSNLLAPFWLRPISHCWAGSRGLSKTVAPWTAIFVSQGAITVTIMTDAVTAALPEVWEGVFPGSLTSYDTPFISDLKFIDIVLRPNSVLFMPAHWYVSWTVHNVGDDTICPMVCSVEYHSPISRFAEWTSRKNQ